MIICIHEKPGWPEFKWDSQTLSTALAGVRYRQGKHLGKMEALGFELRTEASLNALTEEVVKSSAIEGEHLNPGEVRSSIARRLGLDVAGLPRPSREVEGVVEMMLDATRGFDLPLTKERLFGWHAALFPTGRTGMHRITVGAFPHRSLRHSPRVRWSPPESPPVVEAFWRRQGRFPRPSAIGSTRPGSHPHRGGDRQSPQHSRFIFRSRA
jgi:hypothetical protein